MSQSIAVVCEAPADLRTACRLVDQLLVDKIDWIESENLSSYRTWRGYSDSQDFLPWKRVPELAKEHCVTIRGQFRGLPRHPDSHAAAKALKLLGGSPNRPNAVMLIRDSDCDLDRLAGLRDARVRMPFPGPVVIGFAHTKRECWHIAGFEPQHDAEQKAIDDLRQELGFDPTTNSHELTARHDHDKRSAKRVLDQLTSGNPDRESSCLDDLTRLACRGATNGVREFIAEVNQRFVPMFGPRPVN